MLVPVEWVGDRAAGRRQSRDVVWLGLTQVLSLATLAPLVSPPGLCFLELVPASSSPYDPGGQFTSLTSVSLSGKQRG